MRIRAFRGLVPAPELAAEVASVPYDVVDAAEAADLARGRPRSLLHVDRAEIDLPAETDPYGPAVYAKAKENFLKLQREGALRRESEPCLYLYQQEMGGRKQRGLVATCHVDDYDAGIIKRHEKTRKDKEDDRTRLVDELGADTGPIFMTYRDQALLNSLATELTAKPPRTDFTAPDGVRHTVWHIPGGAEWISAFGRVPVAYIADGHHRAASAARVARMRRAANPGHTGDEDYNWFLSVLFPASELKILPYNRVALDLNGLEAPAFLERVRSIFGLETGASPAPEAPGQVSLYCRGNWHGFGLGERSASADAVSRLDVSILQERLLAPILGIEDPRTSKRIDFVGGIRGPEELARRVDAGGGAAFSLFPVTVDQLMAIADAGQIMPPKSTWFEPKLRSGLFIHTF